MKPAIIAHSNTSGRPLPIWLRFDQPNLQINHKKKKFINNIAGWWYTYPSEKYERQLGLFFPEWKNNPNVPNHQ